MTERLTSIDTAIGSAIRAARFSRGLTQSDLAGHLRVTRATVASYETGRRKIPAETLIQIARLCEKPLGFFEPAEQARAQTPTRMRDFEPAEQARAQTPTRMRDGEAAAIEQPALQALTQALQLRPDAIPLVMEFLEAWLSDQETLATATTLAPHESA